MKAIAIIRKVGFVEIAVLLVLHAALLYSFAEAGYVAKVLAMGQQISLSTKAIVGIFFLVRVLAVLCLPGIVSSRLGMMLFDHVCAEPRRAP